MPVTSIDLNIEPGQKVTIQPVSWQSFAAILDELGNKRTSRIAYAKGILEIMSPLPEHERTKVLLADVVKAILKHQKQQWEPLGSTTFKREGMKVGVEPDDCFYIQNYQAVIGKKRVDLTQLPPPDLALETDVTSQTQLDAYEGLGVPELWIYDRNNLAIYLLVEGKYTESLNSPLFPGLDLKLLIPQYMQRAQVVGVSRALAEFEYFLQELPIDSP
jgi:Uma2 family endonuclease